MRKPSVWCALALAFATIIVLPARAHANGSALKPYVVLILDTSGSMEDEIGHCSVHTATTCGVTTECPATEVCVGLPPCGGKAIKLDSARCAISRIVSSYGDIVFALGRFRMTMSGATTAATFPNGCSTAQFDCSTNDYQAELLSGLVDGGNAAAGVWTNLTANTCTAAGSDPEIWLATGNTPIEGSLRATKRYWQGLQATDGTVIWPNVNPGFAPIANDPLNNTFLPSGEQCRPYITILLTDGDETCGGSPANGAATLLSTTVGAHNYRITTKPIGFGITPPPVASCGTAGQAGCQIEDIAHAGGATNIAGQDEGFYASDEAGLELAISKIIEGSIRFETCNGLDDDCDGQIDEDFPCAVTCTGPTCTPACNACNNGKLGVCAVAGANVCRADGTGVACNAGTATCAGKVDGTACTVTDTAGLLEHGTCTSGTCFPTPQSTCPALATCNPDGTEICGNGLDDDCDGSIDEGCPICVPTAEVCNGKDDDCDGIIDEDVAPQQCPITNGFGTCLGVQTCSSPFNPAAPFGACVGQTPTAEVCDGLDNDCDGQIDEDLSVACSNITGNGCTTPPCQATNNPGDPGVFHCSTTTAQACTGPADTSCPVGESCLPPIAQNLCHPGIRQCINGAFTGCTGEQKPVAEICDGLDNDCDNTIDEQTGGGACSTTCGVGTISCAIAPNCGGAGQPACGTLFCSAQPATTNDATCDNIDEDCDGMVDEDWVCSDPTGNSSPAVPCACTSAFTCNGQNTCVHGAIQCMGPPIDPSSCCDCSGNPQPGMCTNGTGCAANCKCEAPCGGGEFPCPLAKKCTSGFCVDDPCFNVTCADVGGNKQVCVDLGNDTSACMDACSQKHCTPPEVCYGPTGQCAANDCTTFPALCTANQNCVVDQNGVGTCVGNPCTNVTCPATQYCEAGECIASCADVTCPSNQRCRLGVCQADPCGHACPTGQVCNDVTGACGNDPCLLRSCPEGQYCNPNDGQCETDGCVGTSCPDPSQVCLGGTCNSPAAMGSGQLVTTGGGGGCNSGGGEGGGAMLLGAVLLLVRRRRGGRS